MIKSKSIPNYEKNLLLVKISPCSETGCWNWTGSLCKAGYGILSIKGFKNNFRAHRVSWTVFRGEIEEGMVIDHICKNKKCINPDHLKETTQLENALNSVGNPVIENRKKEFCIRGHLFSEENTRIRKDGKTRECWICRRMHRKNSKQRMRKNKKEIK